MTETQFDYEQSVWGNGVANRAITSPTSFRLRQSVRALRDLAPGARVMELGCGAGQFIRAVAAIRPDLKCYGSDISDSALAIAKQAHDGVVYDLSGEKRLPYEDGFFDAIVLYDVLEHVPDPDAILSEVARTLKKGGVFFAFVPCEGDVLSIWNALRHIGVGVELTRMYAGHINRFSRNQLFRMIESHGLAVRAKVYSEHIIGQLLGIAAFFSMNRFAKKHKLAQVNNEQYFDNLHARGGGVLRWIKNLVNAVVFIESAVFSRLPSPNVHVTAVKK
jgi:ubiquinone/menaquinone biosynthesis C-methylase UbiE